MVVQKLTRHGTMLAAHDGGVPLLVHDMGITSATPPWRKKGEDNAGVAGKENAGRYLYSISTPRIGLPLFRTFGSGVGVSRSATIGRSSGFLPRQQTFTAYQCSIDARNHADMVKDAIDTGVHPSRKLLFTITISI